MCVAGPGSLTVATAPLIHIATAIEVAILFARSGIWNSVPTPAFSIPNRDSVVSFLVKYHGR